MTAYRIEDLPGRIATKIAVNPVTGCWEWTRSRDDDGYGQIKMGRRVLRTHRVVYELLVGPIPSDRPCLDHVKAWGCKSKACCWPAHLEPVTNAENLRRSRNIPTHCPARHEYTPANLYVPPSGGMQCRACKSGHPPAWTVVLVCPGCGHSRTGPTARYCGDCRCLRLNTKGRRCGNPAALDGLCGDHAGSDYVVPAGAPDPAVSANTASQTATRYPPGQRPALPLPGSGPPPAESPYRQVRGLLAAGSASATQVAPSQRGSQPCPS